MRKLLIVLSFIVTFSGFAQAPDKPTASEIYESIKQLNFLGSVLYIAAHPDDENTALISYFANDVHARTAYISLTRGDGGQNLIGPELNRSEEHTSELQSRGQLVCRLLLGKKKIGSTKLWK